MQRYLCLARFARLYGFDRNCILAWIRKGLIQGAVKIGRQWRIPDPGLQYIQMLDDPLLYLYYAPLFRGREVALICNVTLRCVKLWQQHGKLVGRKIGPVRRYSLDQILNAMQHRKPRQKLDRNVRWDLVDWAKRQIAAGPKLQPSPFLKNLVD